jgi:rRNA maturation RNase YbeY
LSDVILNRQHAVRVAVPALDRFLVRAQRALRFSADALAICLVTNAQMARWNRSFRGKKGPTDVLSFPTNVHAERRALTSRSSRSESGSRGGRRKNNGSSHGLRGTDGLRRKSQGHRHEPPKMREGNSFSSASFRSSASYLGDIAIAPAVARKNAHRFGRTLDDELRILILHGILHLMGYDHETDDGRMDRREQRLHRSLGLA